MTWTFLELYMKHLKWKSAALLLAVLGMSIHAAENQAPAAAPAATPAAPVTVEAKKDEMAEAVKSAAALDVATAAVLGRMVASEPFGHMDFSKEEKQALVEGFTKGLEQPLSQEEAQPHLDAIRAYYGKKMKALKEVKDAETSKKMAQVLVPMEQVIPLSSGGNTTLAKMVAGKKAVLLDFWASWCGPCMQRMPALKHKYEKLTPQGVVVAGMNTDEENPATVAEQVRKDKAMDAAMIWLLEPARIFSEKLNIDSIPRMVLVSPEGKVLYNGDPDEPGLAAALKSVGAEL